MREGRHFPAPILLTLFSFLLAGCFRHPVTSKQPLDFEEHVSRDSLFHYQVPPGWIDLVPDLMSTFQRVWMVSNNQGASIDVREVSRDGLNSASIEENEMHEIAALMMNLIGQQRPGVTNGVSSRQVRDLTIWSFDLYTESGDSVRTALFQMEGRLYESIASKQGDGSDTPAYRDVLSAHEGFLKSLRW